MSTIKTSKYHLTLIRFDTDNSGITSIDKFQGDNLREVLSQLPMAVATICAREQEHAELSAHTRGLINDDDIPF